MQSDKRLRLFISYSHQDNSGENRYIEQFKNHLAPLIGKGLVELWYDRKILPGEPLEEKIDMNLESADVICLMISSNFLSSEACMQEKKKAFELRKKRGVPIISIILSPCAWLDDEELCELLALPTDGKPVSSHGDQKAA